MKGNTKKGMVVNGKYIPRKDLLRDKCIGLVERIVAKPLTPVGVTKLKKIVKLIVSGKLTTKYYTGIISELRKLERGI
jgi:hypothetical protein